MFFFFFFNDTATTEIYTLSLHDALPISTPTLTANSRLVGYSEKSCEAATCGGINLSAVSLARPKSRILACSRSEEHTSELQSQSNLVCRLLLEKKKSHRY